MTIEQAKAILAAPKFGDPKCIEAVQRLADEPEVQRLRTSLVGDWIPCGACSGDSNGCECCDCGKMRIVQELADSWDLYILRDVAAEIRQRFAKQLATSRRAALPASTGKRPKRAANKKE